MNARLLARCRVRAVVAVIAAAVVAAPQPGSSATLAVTVTVIAGTESTPVSDGVSAIRPTLSAPRGAAADAAGNVYIADTGHHRIRKVDAGGVITTVAGDGRLGPSGDGAQAVAASLHSPRSVALDASGRIFFIDAGNRVRRINADGTIVTVAGGATVAGGWSGSATAAGFVSLTALAVEPDGEFWIANGHRIGKVDAAGVLVPIAGTDSCGFSGDGAAATTALLCNVSALAIDGAGRLIVADTSNGRIRRIDVDLTMSTVAGSGANDGTWTDGSAATAVPLHLPTDIAAVGTSGFQVVQSSSIRRGVVSVDDTGTATLTQLVAAGSGADRGGVGVRSVGCFGPGPSSSLLVCDDTSGRVLRIASSGQGSLIAGAPFATMNGTSPSAVRIGDARAVLERAGGITLVATPGFVLRRLGSAVSVFAGNGIIGIRNSDTTAASARIGLVVDMAEGPDGSVYLLEAPSEGFAAGTRVRRVASNGAISTIAGSDIGVSAGDGGPATAATFAAARAIDVAADGTIYIIDGPYVRKIAAGTITLVAGNGGLEATVDGEPAVTASIDPVDVVALADNTPAIADNASFTIRGIDASGNLTTLAGNGSSTASGDGGSVVDAGLGLVRSVGVSAGRLLITSQTGAVRRVDGGLISTVYQAAAVLGDIERSLLADLVMIDPLTQTVERYSAANGRTVVFGSESVPLPVDPLDSFPVDGTPLGSIRGLAVDESGSLFGTLATSGVYRFAPGEGFSNFDPESPLATIVGARGGVVTYSQNATLFRAGGEGRTISPADISEFSAMALDAAGNVIGMSRSVTPQTGTVSLAVSRVDFATGAVTVLQTAVATLADPVGYRFTIDGRGTIFGYAATGVPAGQATVTVDPVVGAARTARTPLDLVTAVFVDTAGDLIVQGTRGGRVTVVRIDPNGVVDDVPIPATATIIAMGTDDGLYTSRVSASGVVIERISGAGRAVAPPSAPLLPVATPGNGRAAMTWNAPTAVNGEPVTDYVVQRKLVTVSTWSPVTDAVSSARSFVGTGLINGTAYHFRVAAKNSAGVGPFSAAVTVTPRTVPSAPTGLTAQVYSGAAIVSWVAPATGGAPITDYVLQRKLSTATAWSTVADGVSTARTYTVTGLANLSGYHFRVAAKNVAGTGVYGAAILATPKAVSSAPTLAARPANKSVVLVWSAPAVPGTTVTDYVIQRKLTSATAWTTLVDGVSVTRSYTATGLVNGSSYQFRLAAKNRIGTGLFSAVQTAIPRTVPTAPGTPSSAVYSAAVMLAWGAPVSTGGAAVTDYVVQRKLPTSTVWTTVVDGVSAGRAATVTGLANGVAYQFRVAAKNAAGVGPYSAVIIATPKGVPSHPTVTAVRANASVRLTWTAPVVPGTSAVTDYVIQRKLASATTWTTLADGVSVTRSYNAVGLANGTAYHFRVAAKNAAGVGIYSAVVAATPAAV